MNSIETKTVRKLARELQGEARKLQGEARSTTTDKNGIYTAAGNVSPMFMDHAVDMATGKNGIAFLIAEVLQEREAVFPANVANTQFRQTAIAAALYTREIEEAVDAKMRAISARYPDATISTYLSAFMNPQSKHFVPKTFQGIPMPRIGQIKLGRIEDMDRPKECRKPRSKWYLID